MADISNSILGCQRFAGKLYGNNNAETSIGYDFAADNLDYHNSISTIDPFCHILEKNAKDEDYSNMSFVGISLLPDRIVGFGDSKSSRMTPLGLREDFELGNMRKVFKNSKFVLCTYDVINFWHMIKDNNNEDHRKFENIHVDKWFSPNINNYTSVYDLLETFQHILYCHPENKGSYRFIEGSWDALGLYARLWRINNFDLMSGTKIYGNTFAASVIHDGNEFYKNYENGTHLISNIPISTYNYEDEVVKSIRTMIHEANKQKCYNPVGDPIITETLYKNQTL